MWRNADRRVDDDDRVSRSVHNRFWTAFDKPVTIVEIAVKVSTSELATRALRDHS